MVDIVAQPRHDLCQLERKEIAGIHRDHLAKLHCRPAQMRQTIGELADIAGVRSRSLTRDRSSAASRLAASASMSPPTPAASRPN